MKYPQSLLHHFQGASDQYEGDTKVDIHFEPDFRVLGFKGRAVVILAVCQVPV